MKFSSLVVSAVACSAVISADAFETTVSTVSELTNAVARASASTDKVRTIILKPGVYDLSTLEEGNFTCSNGKVWGTNHSCDDHGLSHLHYNVSIVFRGEDTTPWHQKTPEQESVLKGNGTMRLLYGYGGPGRGSSYAHLSFEGGAAGTKNGGAILSASPGLAPADAISNCVFRSCSASMGGAVASLNAVDSLFDGNTAQKGGAAYGTSGPDSTASGSPVRTNCYVGCVFVNNKATVSGGGAICCDTFGGLTGCVFSNNTATATYGQGGAVLINGNSTAAGVADCIFAGNSSQSSGGALRTKTKLAWLTGCTFDDNAAQNSEGGGCYAEGGIGTLSDCRFRRNAASGNGGGLLARVEIDRMTDSLFEGNRSGAVGGGALASQSSIGELAGCTFRTNSAGTNAGGLWVGTGLDTMRDCVFEGNVAVTDYGAVSLRSYNKVSGCTFKDNVAGHWYAGVSTDSMSQGGTIENCVFDNNTNQFVNVGSQVHFAKQVTGCTFRGFGDMFAGNYDRCVFEGCSFNYNNYGGGMIVFNATTGAGHLRNCLFTNNTVNVYIKNDTGSTVEIANCTFVGNEVIKAENLGKPGDISEGYLLYAFRGGQDPNVSGNNLPSTNLVVNCVFKDNMRNGVRNDISLYQTGVKVSHPSNSILRNSIYEKVVEDSNFRNAVKSDNIEADPKLVGARAEELGVPACMIRRTSPACGTGLVLPWMAAETDLCGTPMVAAEKVDMGCCQCTLTAAGFLLFLR